MQRRDLTWLVLIPLLLTLTLAINVNSVRAEETAVLRGFVTDSLTGDPISDATVIVLNVYTYEKNIITTDENGFYQINVTMNQVYRLYAYYDSPETPGLDTVPVKSVNLKISKPVTQIDLRLYPGASITLEGKILYISRIGSRYSVYVVDPATGEPPNLNNENENFTNIFTWGPSVRYRTDLGFSPTVVIVPSGVQVDLKVSFTALLKDPLNPMAFPRASRISFPIDNHASHYSLERGELTTADLSFYALLSSINYVNGLFDLTWNRMNEMEDAGFYLGKLKEDMGKVRGDIEQTQKLLSEHKYEEGIELLRTAYSTLMINIAINMNNMWLTANSSAVFMPLYPAFFAVTTAFFIFEDLKKKMISSIFFYAVAFALLYYVYPGLQIVELKFLLSLAVACLLLAFFISFVIPRFIKEPDIPGRYPLQSVLTVVFSIAKRNVKRRLSRGVLGIMSLAILVMAFTAFTSFGRVIGLVITPLNTQPAYEGALVKNIPPIWAGTQEPYWPIVEDEIDWFKEYRGITVVSPLVFNKPQKALTGVLRVSDVELQVHGIIGVDPASEGNFTRIGQLLTSGDLGDLDSVKKGVVISQEAASLLGVGVGEKVAFYAHTQAGLQLYGNLTVVGLINAGDLSGITDMDENPIIPYRFEGGDYRLSTPSQVIIMNWREALKVEDTAIYRIAVKTDGTVDLDAFARNIVQGKEYNVWISSENDVLQYHFGEYLEMGGISLLVPLLIVLFNLGLIMISIVNERTKEIFTLTCVGFNPTHITALFLAESVVMGLVGGGVGYLLGMSAYRLMSIFDVDISVRQKLEWYWSVIGVLIALGTAVLSAIRPASRAALKVTPSLVKKIKYETEKEKLKREEEIWKVYQSQRMTMPIRIQAREITFFASYLSGRMHSLEKGLFERIEGYEESERETPEGHQIRTFNFTYVILESGQRFGTVNTLTAVKRAQDDFYVLSLEVNPEKPGIPGSFIDRTVRFIRDILGDWEEERPRIIRGL